jgi:hypothetical protein
MAKVVEIDQICEYLKATTSIATVLSDRIYYWEPMREQTGIYLTINTVSQVINAVDKQALVEFRLIGHNENVRKKELVAISKLLIDNLVTTNSFQVYKLWDFEVYKIREGGTYRMFVDDKNRNLLIQDFVFQFIN